MKRFEKAGERRPSVGRRDYPGGCGSFWPRWVCFGIAWFGVWNLAQASTIAFQRSLVVDRSVNIFDTSLFDIDLILSRNFSSRALSDPIRLFDEVRISPADVGARYVADRTTSAEFAAAAGRFADAVDEFVFVELRELASGRAEKQGWQESRFFLKSSLDAAPDLAGAAIRAIELHIDSFRTVGGDASTNEEAAGSPPVQLLATLRFIAIPEPSALGGGLCGFLLIAYSLRHDFVRNDAAHSRLRFKRVESSEVGRR